MIEQSLARLWERAASRKSPWDAAAARAQLRELGFDPYAPPAELEVTASPDGGTPEGCASPGEADRAGVESGTPDQARGDVGKEATRSRRPTRHKHWTRAKMAAFLRELGAGRSVAHAARTVGMGRQSAYKLRDRLPGSAFDEAWALADEWRRRRAAPLVRRRW